MIKSAIPFLPGLAASMMLMAGSAQAQYIRLGHAAGWQENGQASWYGGRHNGRPTSSGEIFNQNAMTAAHASLPLGTQVRVTLQGSANSVVVTINDRQPDHGRRIIDLSRGAASRLGMLPNGVGMVTLTSVAEAQPVEVAEAPYGEVAADMDSGDISPRRHGPRHRRHAGRAAAAALQ
jgi:rare lipoprotein A